MLLLLEFELEYIIELAPAEKNICRQIKICEQKKGRTAMKIIKEHKTAAGRLCYELIESTSKGRVCFGVRVSTTLFGDEESAYVEDVSHIYERAEKFFDLIADNAVLPCTLKDIAEDYAAAECMV